MSRWLKFFSTWRINTASTASWGSDRQRWWRSLPLTLSLYDLPLHSQHCVASYQKYLIWSPFLNICSVSLLGDGVFGRRVLFLKLQSSPAAGYLGGKSIAFFTFNNCCVLSPIFWLLLQVRCSDSCSVLLGPGSGRSGALQTTHWKKRSTHRLCCHRWLDSIPRGQPCPLETSSGAADSEQNQTPPEGTWRRQTLSSAFPLTEWSLLIWFLIWPQGATQPPAQATPNRYAPVAGHFFFPLLRNYDK